MIFFRNFGTWSYEGAMVTRGLWELQASYKLRYSDIILDLNFFLDKAVFLERLLIEVFFRI